MPRNLKAVRNQEKAQRVGVGEYFTEGDISTTTLRSDAYVDILTKTSTESAKYFWGQGAANANDTNAGYFYWDLRATGSGAASAADDEVDGTVRFIVYKDSEDEVPIVGPTYSLVDLRDAEDENRTERPVLPLLTPGAGKDKKIACQVKAASGSDGYEIDGSQTNDNALIPYTQKLE